MRLIVRMWHSADKFTTADKYMIADFLTKAAIGRGHGQLVW